MPYNLTGLPLPISLRPAVALTDEELMRFSEQNKPYKIERNREGEITVMTPVGGIGGTHEVYVASAMFNWAEQDERGIGFGSNTGFNLRDGSCLSPDAAWLSRERWDALTLKEQAGFPPLCPEFVIGVRSRSDARSSVEKKMLLWLENGAELAWLIDPIDDCVTIYAPGEEPKILKRPELIQGSGPVAGFALRATRLWSSLDT